jgi:hypothetical protein
MSKITNSKKIAPEDFKDQRPWIEKLLSPINQYFQDSASILNNGILLRDNVMAQDYTTTLRTDGARTTASFSWKWNQKQAPSIVQVAQLIEIGSDTVPATGFTWTFSANSVTCSISNLSASKDYTIKITGVA